VDKIVEITKLFVNMTYHVCIYTVELYYIIPIYGNTMNISMERVHWICFVTDRFWHKNHVPILIFCICLCFSTCHVIILCYSISRRAFSAKIPSILIKHPLSTATQYEILSLLDAGHSARHISVSTGYSYATISRLHSKHHSHLSKSSGGHPSKLSTANICFAQ
jgi:hypothetical protein